MKTVRYAATILLGMICVSSTQAIHAAESTITQPWLISLEIGKLDTEGDAVVNDAYTGTLLLDYALSETFSLEGSVTLVPRLTGNHYDDYSSGAPVRIDRLEDTTGESDTWAVGAAVDTLYHLARRKHFDPYLSAGLGILRYGEDVGENNGMDVTPRVGAGILHRLSETLCLRADYRYFVAGTFAKSESNSRLDIGIAWAPGIRKTTPPLTTVTPQLSDRPIPATGTREDLTGKTTPETNTYERELHELHIEFASGSAILEAQYHEHLDVIGKILKDNPAATATIEGHCDQRQNDSAQKATDLTRQRAEAVRDYLAGGKWKIAKHRMDAMGYGFSRPKKKADLENGNPANRRIDIYVARPAGSSRQAPGSPAAK